MEFNIKRYAQGRIDFLKAKHNLAITHGGDVDYFTRLIASWQGYLNHYLK